MTLLDAHLEQISLCAASIAELPFPPPKIFTNALLQPHDITTFIRDTEIHERALFSVPPPPPLPKAQDPTAGSNRRNTIFNISGGNNSSIAGGGANGVRAPRRNTAVAAVLGTELADRIRRGGGGGVGTGLGYRTFDGNNKGEVDVDTLLEGAEKLLGVYPLPGVRERIAAIRQRYSRLQSSIEFYENRLAEQAAQLSRLNRSRDYAADDADEGDVEPEATTLFQPLSENDLRKEEEEIRQLERKKKGLEERVTSMGRDISGVLR
ncbi:DASH complex, subunit Spc34 [Westerdykella ornata]|uniref:DASH complex subunit SPC34 n=1 Tax=Westerdykella ornata TaxID=318751 RepID=A0A6A6JD86_WESOR|nr:DASH complex, subunit Spc34 [Westerdykella ornata]KAF2273958.1 DASH complex, subunit Spc34 [Westerdykella ornata]